jgi:type I restriction enzyme S subunit
MKSTYKRLGDCIQEVDMRNRSLEITNLIGLSIQKMFIPSISNTIGTDMSTYRIIQQDQFAYCPVTSRNGEKITIALYDKTDTAIISQAYNVFEIINKEILLPPYLMMWFRRPEFDRYARFKSHGSVREIFDWEEMCNVKLPIPSLERQREIVAEYNTVQKRIDLNNQLIQKLEETAMAIYKQWFVDFEFPDENGKPYKSNGGEMEESELGEIPKGWRGSTIKDFCTDMKSGGTPSRNNIEYWDNNDVPWLKTGEIKSNILINTEEYVSFEGLKNSSAKMLPKNTVLMSMYGVNAGEIGILKFEACTNQACCGMICNDEHESVYLYYHLLHNQEYIASQAIGGAQENLSKDFIEKIYIIIPKGDVLKRSNLKIMIDNKEIITREIYFLEELQSVLLSKLSTIN